MQLELECELREAYYTSDDEMPSLVFAGIANPDEIASSVRKPIEMTVRGRALELNGALIGSKHLITITLLPEKP